MRLTDSHLYSYKNKYNLIGGNASNNFKKKKKEKKEDLTNFREIIHLFS